MCIRVCVCMWSTVSIHWDAKEGIPNMITISLWFRLCSTMESWEQRVCLCMYVSMYLLLFKGILLSICRLDAFNAILLDRTSPMVLFVGFWHWEYFTAIAIRSPHRTRIWEPKHKEKSPTNCSFSSAPSRSRSARICITVRLLAFPVDYENQIAYLPGSRCAHFTRRVGSFPPLPVHPAVFFILSQMQVLTYCAILLSRCAAKTHEVPHSFPLVLACLCRTAHYHSYFSLSKPTPMYTHTHAYI